MIYLDVERKVGDVNRTGRFEYRRWNPQDSAVAEYDRHSISSFAQSRVGAARQ